MEREYIPYSEKCFMCGDSNLDGLRLKLYRDGEKVKADLRIDERFIGYENMIHGGVVCGLLDEVMVWAAVIFGSKRSMYVTVDINVKYHAPVPAGEEVTVEGWVVEEKGRMAFCEARILKGEKVLASGSGRFLALSRSKLEEMLPQLKFDRAPKYKNFFG